MTPTTGPVPRWRIPFRSPTAPGPVEEEELREELAGMPFLVGTEPVCDTVERIREIQRTLAYAPDGVECLTCTRHVEVQVNNLTPAIALFLERAYEAHGLNPWKATEEGGRQGLNRAFQPSRVQLTRHLGLIEHSMKKYTCDKWPCKGTETKLCDALTKRRLKDPTRLHEVKKGVFAITRLGEAWLLGKTRVPVGILSYDGHFRGVRPDVLVSRKELGYPDDEEPPVDDKDL